MHGLLREFKNLLRTDAAKVECQSEVNCNFTCKFYTFKNLVEIKLSTAGISE